MIYNIDDLKTEFQMGISSAKSAIPEAAKVLKAYRGKVASIQANDDLSQTGRTRQIEQAHDEARDNLNAIFGKADDGIGFAQDAIVGALERPEQPVDAQLLHELRLQGAWNRYSRMLDAGRDTEQVIQAAGNDPVALEALRRELPAYLSATVNGTDRDVQNDLDAANIALDQAGEPHLSDLEAKAKGYQQELDAGTGRLKLARQTAYKALDPNEPATALPAWSSDPRDSATVEISA